MDDPDDFVVLEIKTALDRNIRVIPVLVDGALMPRRDELPAELANLTRRHAVRLDHDTFRSVKAVRELSDAPASCDDRFVGGDAVEQGSDHVVDDQCAVDE